MKKTENLKEAITFVNSELKVYSVNTILLPTNTFIMFTEAFKNDKVDIDKLIFSLGLIEGESLLKSFAYEIRQNLNAFSKVLDFLKFAGFGNFKIEALDLKKPVGIISNASSAYAKQYIKMFGNQDKTVCQYVAGILKVGLSVLVNKNIMVAETNCVAKGNLKCIFNFKAGKNKSIENELKKLLAKPVRYTESSLPNVKAPLLEKVLAQDLITLENGDLNIWGVSIVLVPVQTLLLFQQYLWKQFGSRIEDLLYIIAKKQAISGAEIQMKLYGRKNDKKLYLSMLQQADIIGLGKVTLVEYDRKNKISKLTCTNSVYLKYYQKMFKSLRPINYYLAGLIAGVSEAFFREKMKTIEIDVFEDNHSIFLAEKGGIQLSKRLVRLLDKNFTVKAFLK